jgi:hypothetical protein
MRTKDRNIFTNVTLIIALEKFNSRLFSAQFFEIEIAIIVIMGSMIILTASQHTYSEHLCKLFSLHKHEDNISQSICFHPKTIYTLNDLCMYLQVPDRNFEKAEDMGQIQLKCYTKHFSMMGLRNQAKIWHSIIINFILNLKLDEIYAHLSNFSRSTDLDIDIREFKIYDAAGSTTRSEFQLKNER